MSLRDDILSYFSLQDEQRDLLAELDRTKRDLGLLYNSASREIGDRAVDLGDGRAAVWDWSNGIIKTIELVREES